MTNAAFTIDHTRAPAPGPVVSRASIGHIATAQTASAQGALFPSLVAQAANTAGLPGCHASCTAVCVYRQSRSTPPRSPRQPLSLPHTPGQGVLAAQPDVPDHATEHPTTWLS